MKDGVLALQTDDLGLELTIFYNEELRHYEWVVLSLDTRLSDISEEKKNTVQDISLEKFGLIAH